MTALLRSFVLHIAVNTNHCIETLLILLLILCQADKIPTVSKQIAILRLFFKI